MNLIIELTLQNLLQENTGEDLCDTGLRQGLLRYDPKRIIHPRTYFDKLDIIKTQTCFKSLHEENEKTTA